MTDDRTIGSGPAPWYHWGVAVIALLWNGLGVLLWSGTSFMSDTFLEGMPTAHREYVAGLPAWSVFTWGLGVLGGFAGSILLLLRHRLAVLAFALSLLGALVNSLVYLTNPPPAGFFNLPLTLFIIGFALFSWWFARWEQRRGILAPR